MAIDITTVLDGIPFKAKAEPFDFNNEKRYKIQYDGKEYIFAFNTDVGRFIAIGDDAVNIPDNLEIYIAEKLERA